jgi:hypothetical protein
LLATASSSCVDWPSRREVLGEQVSIVLTTRGVSVSSRSPVTQEGLPPRFADHRDFRQWVVFILPATALPPQKTLRLSRLKAINGVAHPFMGPERCAEEMTRYAEQLAPNARP